MVAIGGSQASGRLGGGWTPARIAILSAVLAAVALVFALGLPQHLSLSELRAERGVLLGFVHAHPWKSAALYILAYCGVVALSLPGALVMTLTGGFLFGVLGGGAAAVTGVSSGAILMFLAARTAMGEGLRGWVERRRGLIHAIQSEVRAHPFSAMLTLRLIPAAPIWIVNLAASFVGTPFRAYALATILGVIPSTFLYASVGAGLNRLFDHGRTGDLLGVIRDQLLWPAVGLTALALLPIAYRAWSGRAAPSALPKAPG